MGPTETVTPSAVQTEQFQVMQPQQFPFPVDPLGMLLLQSLYMLMYGMMMVQRMMMMPMPQQGMMFQQPQSGYKIVELKRDANGNITQILEKW